MVRVYYSRYKVIEYTKKQLFLSIFFMLSLDCYAAVHHPLAFVNQIKNTANEGQQVVKHYCATCHAKHPLIFLGAPRIGVMDDWQLRLRQGFPTLFDHTAAGYHAMPARGGCFECSDKQLKLAIAALLEKTSTSN